MVSFSDAIQLGLLVVAIIGLVLDIIKMDQITEPGEPPFVRRHPFL